MLQRQRTTRSVGDALRNPKAASTQTERNQQRLAHWTRLRRLTQAVDAAVARHYAVLEYEDILEHLENFVTLLESRIPLGGLDDVEVRAATSGESVDGCVPSTPMASPTPSPRAPTLEAVARRCALLRPVRRPDAAAGEAAVAASRPHNAALEALMQQYGEKMTALYKKHLKHLDRVYERLNEQLSLPEKCDAPTPDDTQE